MNRQLSRIKTEPRPKIPGNNMQILELFQSPDIIEKNGLTLDKSARFYIDTVLSEQYSFIIFASFAILNLVRRNIDPEQRHYLIDGTFKVVPRTFYQLLIVSIEFQNDVSSKWYHFLLYFFFIVSHMNSNLMIEM